MKIKISPEFRKKMRDWIVAQLKGQFIKLLLKTLIKSSGGFQVWLITFIGEELYEEVGQPYLEKWLRGAGYRLDRHEGKLLIKALEEAQDANSRNRAADDILG